MQCGCRGRFGEPEGSRGRARPGWVASRRSLAVSVCFRCRYFLFVYYRCLFIFAFCLFSVYRAWRFPTATASRHTDNVEFQGFDSVRFLILRGGIPRSVRASPKLQNQRSLVCGFLVWTGRNLAAHRVYLRCVADSTRWAKEQPNRTTSDVYNYRLRSCLTACRKGLGFSLPLCRKDAKSSSPLPLTGPYSLEGNTLAKRLAASRGYKHSCTIVAHPVRILAESNKQDERQSCNTTAAAGLQPVPY